MHKHVFSGIIAWKRALYNALLLELLLELRELHVDGTAQSGSGHGVKGGSYTLRNLQVRPVKRCMEGRIEYAYTTGIQWTREPSFDRVINDP